MAEAVRVREREGEGTIGERTRGKASERDVVGWMGGREGKSERQREREK